MEPVCYVCGQPSAEKWTAESGGRPTCYAHCSASQDGLHAPKWDDSTIYSEHGVVQIDENRILVDVPCSACGQSGSIAVSIVGPDATVQWA